MEKINQSSELLEIYKLHCEIGDRVSQRRSQTNQFYITVLSALIGILSLSTSNEFRTYFNYMAIIGGLMGIILCLIWIVNIRSYRQLNTAKFKTLHEVEKRLSFQFYSEEWTHLGEGKDSKKYYQLTKIEQFAPILLSLPFILLILLGFFK